MISSAISSLTGRSFWPSCISCNCSRLWRLSLFNMATSCWTEATRSLRPKILFSLFIHAPHVSQHGINAPSMASIILSDAVVIFLPLLCTNNSCANKDWRVSDWLEFRQGHFDVDRPIWGWGTLLWEKEYDASSFEDLPCWLVWELSGGVWRSSLDWELRVLLREAKKEGRWAADGESGSWFGGGCITKFQLLWNVSKRGTVWGFFEGVREYWQMDQGWKEA